MSVSNNSHRARHAKDAAAHKSLSAEMGTTLPSIIVTCSILIVIFSIVYSFSSVNTTLYYAKPQAKEMSRSEQSIDVLVFDFAKNLYNNKVALNTYATVEQRSTIDKVVGQEAELEQFGSDNQKKLMKLANEEIQAIPFVDRLIAMYPSDINLPITEEVETGRMLNLYQWDTRWGYKEYSSAPFGLTGCCPTSLSMVVVALTGNADFNPGVVGDYAKEKGYVSEYDGTLGDFLVKESAYFGVKGVEAPIDAYALRTGLSEGSIFIANVGVGDFTDDGHFLVIYDITETGELCIADPFSSLRSGQTWNIDTVITQTIALYAFSV